MLAPLLLQIDWQRPWLLPLRPIAEPLIRAGDCRRELNRLAAAAALKNHRGLPIRFVPQEELPDGTAYESHISTTGAVPTRDNLHDFFNALVWLAFPETKARLNALQAAELEKALAITGGASMSRRGSTRDAATIFDENAALLVVRNPDLLASLHAHDWQQLFVARREEFRRDAEIFLFGHALMEKLVRPYKAITAHSFSLVVDASYFELSAAARRRRLDELVCLGLKDGLSTASFSPLPLLGIPGWWETQDESFYADTAVFRPKRTKS